MDPRIAAILMQAGMSEETFISGIRDGKLGSSVTQRIKKVKQPRGGYIQPKQFTTISLGDGIDAMKEENASAGLVGMAVDYLTRFITGTPVKDAFAISMRCTDT